MEFWGIEINPGTTFKVELEDGYYLHISQMALGDVKSVKDENSPVYVNVVDDDDNKQKLVIGTLSQNIPQATNLDIVFEQDFELSHECKSSSVFVLGYKAPDFQGQEEIDSDDSDKEEARMEFLQGLTKQNAKMAQLEDGESDSDDEDEDSDEDDESDEEKGFDEAPLKVEPPSKKRPNGGAMNNNTVASKKAKVAIPQKPSGGKKGGKCQGPCASSCKN